MAVVAIVVLGAVPGVAVATIGDRGQAPAPTVRRDAPPSGPIASTSGAPSTTNAPSPSTTRAKPPRASDPPKPASSSADDLIEGNIVQVEGGGYHTCLRLRGGTVYCWGQGAYGQLGTGTHFRGTPTRALLTGAVEVQAGGRFTCARRADGQVLCWGEDDHRQLGGPPTEECGDATIDSVCAPLPRRVSGLASAVGLAAGDKHACALLRNGTVACWGSNEQGQLGGSAAADRQRPSAVGGVTGARQVVAGDHHTCALIGRPGTVRCWGDNEVGQAGGQGTRVTSPVTVAGLGDIVEIVGGGAHSCARHAGGTVSCWGYNYLGQLGVGSTRPTSTSRPLAVRGLTGVVQLAAGRYHTCARRAGGTVACWGLNRKGELGNGATEDRATPTRVTAVGDAQYLATGRWHYCVIRGNGSLSCWGDNLGGQLGTGGVNDRANPVPVAVRSLPRR